MHYLLINKSRSRVFHQIITYLIDNFPILTEMAPYTSESKWIEVLSYKFLLCSLIQHKVTYVSSYTD